MRTNIDIDDALMAEALRASGLKTKRAAVEAGLRLLVRLKRQAAVRELFGQLRWEGSLEESRTRRIAR
jgi:Arc/MetJ family transcription regulator